MIGKTSRRDAASTMPLAVTEFGRATGDSELRALARDNPRDFADRLGYELKPDVDVKAVENEEDLFWVVFPGDPNRHLSSEMLGGAVGGRSRSGDRNRANGCASTLSTLPSCVSSFSSKG